jgi:hypothetical protein
VAGVGSANASSVLAAGALLDGSSTAKTINLNIKFDDSDLSTGNGAADVVGKITILWSYLADY